MKILALEPYYGGSHQAFLDGWHERSRHEWTLFTLPAHHWKWRMRHAAVSFAAQLEEYVKKSNAQADWDCLITTSMLNLAEFRGLAPPQLRGLPAVVYFHENQLTYPVQCEDRRDLHFAMTHLVSIRAADSVWFNSAFHRDEFFEAADRLVRRMPDDSLRPIMERAKKIAQVAHPGIERPARSRTSRRRGPLKILWAARWEFDKNPETFFEAIEILKQRGIPFRLNVVGEQFSDVPEIFAKARDRFRDEIDRWGYQPTRDAYQAALTEADVFVSTANHEFFGLSVVEAIAAGARPLLPRRLSYPELLAPVEQELGADGKRSAAENPFFYDGHAESLADRLESLSHRLERDGSLQTPEEPDPQAAMERFYWESRAAAMDQGLEKVMENTSES